VDHLFKGTAGRLLDGYQRPIGGIAESQHVGAVVGVGDPEDPAAGILVADG
jgi:hypothetical protein